MSSPLQEVAYVGDDDSQFFRRVHGRTLNTLNPLYLLPADEDERRRCDFHHRLVQFLFGGKNYIGPVKEALQFGQHRRILDLGTGPGTWAIEMADEFPRAEVIGIDLAPIQPRSVPPNCTFELCDLDQGQIPYPDDYFDLIHARSMHIGIRDYRHFLREISRVLRPGGLLIIIEPDLEPSSSGGDASGMSGWWTLWETYRACLARTGIDISVPRSLQDLLVSIGTFEHVIRRDGNVPVGFWPTDPNLLTVGQLQWMDYDLLLPALRPLFLCSGLTEEIVTRMIENAQQDLYQPVVNLSTCINIVHATKRPGHPGFGHQ